MTKKQKKEVKFWKINCLILAILCVLMLTAIILMIVLNDSFQREYHRIIAEDLNSSEILDKNLSEILDECKNLSLKETVICIQPYIAKNYNYIENKTGENETLDGILVNGGNCVAYTKLWNETLNRLGFNKTRGEDVWFTNESGHRFLLVWDKSQTYCKLDQKNIGCWGAK